MTLEEFAHRCLMIKAGNATLDIPCCANCEHYTKVVIGNEVRTDEIPGFKLIDKSIKWECYHPALEVDDPFGTVWLETKPEDFCSRWESRNEEKEVKEKNKKARKRSSKDYRQDHGDS